MRPYYKVVIYRFNQERQLVNMMTDCLIRYAEVNIIVFYLLAAAQYTLVPFTLFIQQAVEAFEPHRYLCV